MRWTLPVLLLAVGCVPEPDARQRGLDGSAGGASADGARMLVDATEAVRPGDAAVPDAAAPDPDAPDQGPPPPPPPMQPACDDGIDNDRDGRADLFDPGCAEARDDDETDPTPLPECGDGRDNDDDGRLDYPSDDDCTAAGDDSEGLPCDPALSMIDVAGGADLLLEPADGQPLGFASCGDGVGRESVLRITLDAPSTVEVTAETVPAGGQVLLYARTQCTRPASEVACRPPADPRPLRLEAWPAGEYFVFVQWATPGRVPTQVRVRVAIEAAATECNDDVDNDGDGVRDLADPGCQAHGDPSEADPPSRPECADGRDNDADGRIDWPADEHCTAAGDFVEGPLCRDVDHVLEVGAGEHLLELDLPQERADGRYRGSCGGWGAESVVAISIDRPSTLSAAVDGGRTDVYLRAGCDDPASEVACRSLIDNQSWLDVRRLEPGTWFLFVDSVNAQGRYQLHLVVEPIPTPECADDRDNDGDGRTDLADPGCFDADDPSEVDADVLPVCANDVDDDGDGRVDYPLDVDCHAAGWYTELPRCLEARTIEVGQAGAVVDFAPPVHDRTSPSCNRAALPETVFALTLDVPSSVWLDLDVLGAGFPTTSLALRDDCNRPALERACNRDQLRFARLEPGTYYVFAEIGDDQRGGQIEGGRLTFDILPLVRACGDGEDNDEDGLTDDDDPGCAWGMDDDEADPRAAPACANGADDDEDGATDFPDDADCQRAGQDSEGARCDADVPIVELVDEGGVVEAPANRFGGAIHGRCVPETSARETVVALTLTRRSSVRVVSRSAYVRAGCDDVVDLGCARFDPVDLVLDPGTYFVVIEAGLDGSGRAEIFVESLVRACNDEVDNDEDGLVDAADPGCAWGMDDNELDPDDAPACANGADDDGDGDTDYPDDADCGRAGQRSEAARCDADVPVVEVDERGGVFRVEANQAGGVIESGCEGFGGDRARETVFAVTLDDLANLRVTYEGDFDTAVYVRSRCDDDRSQLGCAGRGGRVLDLRALEAGTYFVVVDPAAVAPGTVTIEVESLVRECGDEVDNDGDGLVDAADPGCRQAFDDDERDPDEPPVCADGVDNDEDGATDFPDDDDCRAAGWGSESQRCGALDVVEVGPEGGVFNVPAQVGLRREQPSCDRFGEGRAIALAIQLEGLSNVTVVAESDGFEDIVLSARVECTDALTEFGCEGFRRRLTLRERGAGTWYVLAHPERAVAMTLRVSVENLIGACNDEVDNDEDGLLDLDDPGCSFARDPSEEDPDEPPECADGEDNDEDGDTDYPDDASCVAAGDASERALCRAIPDVVEVVQMGGRFAIDTSARPPTHGFSCAGAAEPHPVQVVAVTLTEPSSLRAETVDIEYDTALELRRDCDDELAVVQCDDDRGPDAGLASLVEAPRLEPGTYYILVGGFAGDTGRATLVVSVEAL